MAESVKVAVRVRPFNDREKNRKATMVIGMDGNQTSIKESAGAEPKKFAFDYSYWSHDGFKERSDGYLEPSSSKYADQKKVFDDLGRGVLENAWKGYNCSLFAYGQTGSGKSYSMVGYGVNKGIVPLACEELFKGIDEKRKNAGKDEEYQVSYSMLEIYSEQVRDLLRPETLKVKGGLKVRESPNVGFYVEELKQAKVDSYKEIEAKMNEGTKNRTVASTNMNATSSRAHTIVAIKFSQKSSSSGKSMTKTSVMNLVDLAGSERAESTGATGDRLKEGAAINQSLSTLGNVIKSLADQCTGKKNVKVPYRDSVLTKLLKNALGGNSKTIMIAALSPADINYDETLSTLRFADRAKAIKTTAVINESPTDKLIRELKEENAKLMEMLKKGGAVPGGPGGADPAEVEDLKKQMEEVMKKNQEEMEAMEQNWKERMAEHEKELVGQLEAEKKKEEQRKVIPHFWNLNEDPSLSGMIVHFCPDGKTTVGSANQEKKPGIPLGGLGIIKEHALIEHKKDIVTVKPHKNAKVVLNGNQITDKKELHHNDRVMFGTSNLFVFYHPRDLAKQEKNKKLAPAPTFETAQQEIAEKTGMSALLKHDGTVSQEDLLLQEDLVQLWPMVTEANAMSEELDKKVKFEIALIAPQASGKKHGRTEVCVKMKKLDKSGAEFMFDRNSFIERKYLMQEMYQNFADGDKDWDLPDEQNPFWVDPITPVLIGTVHLFLQPLAYMVEADENLQITDYKGTDQGSLMVKMFACTKTGEPLPDDEFVEEPQDLIGKPYQFKMQIPHARGLHKRFVKSFCKFEFYIDGKMTQTEEGKGCNPDYGYERLISANPVSKNLVDFLENESLRIEVWGRQAEVSGATSSLNTRELVIQDNQKMAHPAPAKDISPNDPNYRMAQEANTFKKRMERAEAKVKKIKELVEASKKTKKGEVKISDLEQAINKGFRFKAAANIVVQMQKTQSTSASSQACVLQ